MPARSSPSSVMRPAQAWRRSTARKVVVLPQPLGPSTAVIALWGTAPARGPAKAARARRRGEKPPLLLLFALRDADALETQDGRPRFRLGRIGRRRVGGKTGPAPQTARGAAAGCPGCSPRAATRPPSLSRMNSSAVSSHSAGWWSIAMMVRPCRCIRRSISISSRAASRSRLAKHSSNSRQRHSITYRQASAARCFSPPDSVCSGRSSSACTPSSAAAASMRGSIAAASRQRFSMQKRISPRSVSMQNCRSGFWNSMPTWRARCWGSMAARSVAEPADLPAGQEAAVFGGRARRPPRPACFCRSRPRPSAPSRARRGCPGPHGPGCCVLPCSR